MSRLRVLVVDDEPLAREMLASLVERDPELEVAGQAADGLEALELIRRLSPEIVLLDIEMPGRDGLAAVRRLEPSRRPLFVFVTAYAEYAPEAFEVEAVDYVLKPVSEPRLAEALGRVKRRIRERRLSRVAEQVASLTAEIGRETSAAAPPAGVLSRLPITVDGRTRFIEASDIVWIESQDYYVRVHTREKSRLLRSSLQSLEEKLDPALFCRIHRGALVNVREVVEVQTLFKGAHAVVLTSGKRLRVSRSRWKEVRETLAPSLRSGSPSGPVRD